MALKPNTEITIELTNKCPNNCLFCSTEANKEGRTFIKYDDLVAFVDKMHNVYKDNLFVNLSGGDPFQHPDLKKIVNYLNSLDYIDGISIYTAGYTQTSNTPAPLHFHDLPNLPSLSVVFDLPSLNKDTFKKITNTNNNNILDKIKQSIYNALNEGMDVELAFLLTLINKDDFDLLVNYAKKIVVNENKIKRIRIIRFVPQGRGWYNRKKLSLNDSQIHSFFEHLDSEYIGEKQLFKIGNPFSCFTGKGFSCTAGSFRCVLTPHNTISPCEAYKKTFPNRSIRLDDFLKLKPKAAGKLLKNLCLPCFGNSCPVQDRIGFG